MCFVFKVGSIPFLKREKIQQNTQYLISTDNFFFWNKCSSYAYQTQPPPPFFNAINLPVMYNLSF